MKRKVLAVWILNTNISSASGRRILTFTELESLTSFRTTRFLTLNSTRIASYESFRSQDSLIFRINLYQRTRDSQTGSLRLTFETTTVKVDLNIILLCDVQLC